MLDGLKALGVEATISHDAVRRDGLAVLLGTSRWRHLEFGEFLLVDRCSFGDTNGWVSLVRNGHGRRGDHRVPANPDPARWERYRVPVADWQTGPKVVLCGQHESWSPHWRAPDDWYASVRGATHFRPHPAGGHWRTLPLATGWDGVGRAITLNSSVGVDAVLRGIPTVTMDEAAMAWDVTSHDPAETATPDRLPWLHWLAWTQWTHDEVSEGTPWAHLLS